MENVLLFPPTTIVLACASWAYFVTCGIWLLAEILWMKVYLTSLLTFYKVMTSHLSWLGNFYVSHPFCYHSSYFLGHYFNYLWVSLNYVSGISNHFQDRHPSHISKSWSKSSENLCHTTRNVPWASGMCTFLVSFAENNILHKPISCRSLSYCPF